MVLSGRLGLETARIPHTDRFGLLWLERGRLAVEDGNLVFTTAGTDSLEAGAYDLPFQQVSNILAGPGTVVSHDALRLLARHKTGIIAVGSNGVRIYAVSMPFGPDHSELARKHARIWNDEESRINVAKKMYRIRLGKNLPEYKRDIKALRGIEGSRMKEVYRQLASQYGVEWKGRRYNRGAPESDDIINKAINHAATATYASARIAVALTGTIPQLGFIHEASGHAFALDIADLFRSSTTLPIAFQATKRFTKFQKRSIESVTRKLAGNTMQQEDTIPAMIDRIKELLDADDDSNNP